MKKHRKGNILLLVLFIMIVSSLLGLLISQYVSNLIRVSNLFHDYYKGYYHAYGGLELGLAQSLEHGYGFEDSLAYSGFSSCTTGSTCHFSLEIDARFFTLDDSSSTWESCAIAAAEGDLYSVISGDGLIIPLFWDTATGFDAVSYDNVTDNELITMDPVLYNEGTSGDEYRLQVIDEDLENYNTTVYGDIGSPTSYAFATDLSGYVSNPGNKNYLTIVNSSGSLMEFCIDIDDMTSPLPGKYIVIDSIGKYGNSTVSLGAVKTNQLPSYLLYSALE